MYMTLTHAGGFGGSINEWKINAEGWYFNEGIMAVSRFIVVGQGSEVGMKMQTPSGHGQHGGSCHVAYLQVKYEEGMCDAKKNSTH